MRSIADTAQQRANLAAWRKRKPHPKHKPHSHTDPQFRNGYAQWSRSTQEKWDAWWHDPEGMVYALIEVLAAEPYHA